jgi:hypothetical protein
MTPSANDPHSDWDPGSVQPSALAGDGPSKIPVMSTAKQTAPIEGIRDDMQRVCIASPSSLRQWVMSDCSVLVSVSCRIALARRLAYAYPGPTPSVLRQVGDLLLGKIGCAQVEPMQQARAVTGFQFRLNVLALEFLQQAGGWVVQRHLSRGYALVPAAARVPAGPDA